ncbi:MAG: hypothetical protein R3B57_05210 [Phycisphaerales bacterium]
MARLAPTLLALLFASPVSLAGAPPTLEPQFVEAMRKADEFEPARRLGVRAAVLRAAQKIIPTVVIVPDAASYVEAVATWDGHTRFPVLIDDGSPRASEDIARFVRAFKPEHVVHWSTEGAELPAAREPKERRLAQAWADALSLPPDTSDADALATLRAAGIDPPGLVVTSATDPAWTGALALAAGRFEPLRFIEDPGGIPSGFWKREVALRVETQIEQLAQQTSLDWRALGDDLDAVTLVLDAPLNFRDDTQNNTPLALSDRLGRLDDGTRWAWGAQIVGTESVSAYRAMCALFLEVHAAWTFDAYPVTGDWTRYDNAPAVEILRDRGVEVTALDAPRSGLTDWRYSTLNPIDADLVLVNTKGSPTYFDLNPGQGASADAPQLDRPVILHLIHSFSLARGDASVGIGGMWMERGAYASLGAVDEPYLQAFVPPRILVGRLASGYPWGAAVRADNAPMWKLATLGDPLITLSTAGSRTDQPLPLGGATDVADSQRESLATGKIEDAVRALALLGRDEEAADLVTPLLARERADELTPALTAAAIPSLFRVGRAHDCLVAASANIEAVTQERMLMDMVWTAGRSQLLKRGDESALAIAVMRRLIRGTQVLADALELGDAIKLADGPEPAAAFVDEVAALAKKSEDQQKLTDLAADYRAGRR